MHPIHNTEYSVAFSQIGFIFDFIAKFFSMFKRSKESEDMAKFEKVDEDLDDDDDPDTRKSISGIDKKKVKAFLTNMPKKIVANE